MSRSVSEKISISQLIRFRHPRFRLSRFQRCRAGTSPQPYARWKEAEEFISQHGTIVKTPSGYYQQLPQVSIAQTYLKIMNRFAEQFGLTPASRSRIVAADTAKDTDDEMEKLLGGDG